MSTIFTYAFKNISARIFQSTRRLPACHNFVRKYADTGNRDKTATTDEDAPLKYSTSEAAAWKAIKTRGGDYDETKPWYQNIVISVSVTVFLVYFCYLREENYVDEELKRSLYDRIPGLEEQQLRALLKYNEENGKDTAEIEQRLKELVEQKSIL